ncbi:hypothetical protein PE067_10660 [Paracoccus sp. DMF-8]|uniref:hypothetical protein n=1 Tax=Paracoccus sp. DMF-8 TaxID=3019445 RepID=UPI0023E7B557|nr:hypothetical protein [Paracoccus sp. DMF-8]MDF3606562.1 hypothetical protein [Paracoccus sp. DMF-8]
MAYTQVDLSGLPAPKVIEELSFEAILAEMKEVVALNMPELAPVLSVERDGGQDPRNLRRLCAADAGAGQRRREIGDVGLCDRHRS